MSSQGMRSSPLGVLRRAAPARARLVAPTFVALLVGLAAALALTALPASAALRRPLLVTVPAPHANFESGWLAEDAANGDVYLTDAHDGTVRKYDPSENPPTAATTYAPDPTSPVIGAGTLSEPRGVAVDQAGGDLYVADFSSGDVYEFSPSGSLLRTIAVEAGLQGIAVDSGGRIYVVSPGDGAVHKLTPAGVPDPFLPLIGSGTLVQPSGVAVDSAGNVYVADLGSGPAESHVYKFDPAGELDPSTPTIGKGANVAVDAAGGEVYVANEELDQFDPSGTLQLTISPADTGLTGGAKGVAVDAATKALYLNAGFANSIAFEVFGPSVVVPDLSTGPVEELRPQSAVLTGTVDPDGAGPATCSFAWGSSTALGNLVPCDAGVPDGNAPTPVRAGLAGLRPDTTYFYRLQATNANGANPGEGSALREFTTSGAGISAQSVSDVSSESALLEASIDPNGSPTSYYFQFGTDAHYGSTLPLPPGRALGSGKGAVEVVGHLEGLYASTTYHYRVVAVSELAPGQLTEFDGPDQTFITQADAVFSLPDGRGWELVSPPEKQGAALEPIGQEGLIQAAADGSALAYHSDAPTEALPAGYANQVQIFSARGPNGWQTADIPLPHQGPPGKTEGVGEDYRFFSEDLSRAIVQPSGAFIPASSAKALAPAEASEQTAFLRNDYLGADPTNLCSASCYRPLVTAAPGFADVPPGTVFGQEGRCPTIAAACGPQFRGSSADAEHVVVGSFVALSASPPLGGEEGLYEWSAGQIAPVSVLPNGEAAPAPELGVEGSGGQHTRQAISADGSRVFWTANGTHLYMRDLASQETIQLDAVTDGSGIGASRPVFQTATADGSVAFFTDAQQLTLDSGGDAESGKRDLYRCEILIEAGKPRCLLTDLTPSSGGRSAGVFGSTLVSEDGSFVYFFASGAQQGGCSGLGSAAERCNLYVLHDGATELVAALSGEDAPDWGIQGGGVPQTQTSRVSPDGRWLAFMSELPLTGYDNRDTVSGKPDEEVFLYHAAAGPGGEGKLVCASCNPSGARPQGSEYLPLTSGQGGLVGGNTIWAPHQWLAANIPGWTSYNVVNSIYQSRYLSNGGRLFFNSSDALTSQDANGREDVYEYEPPQSEVGPLADSCATSSPSYSPGAEGCISLISSATSGAESAFLDASESGADVFFLTQSRLSPQDTDQALDVYDARVGGGEIEPVGPPPPCGGEACQPTSSPAIEAAPGTSTFNGPVKPAACAKGKVRRGARCVKKKAKKAKHHTLKKTSRAQAPGPIAEGKPRAGR